MTRPTENERFDDKVSPEPNTGCFLWMAGEARGGYGKFSVGTGASKRTHIAHRWAWEREHGPVPTGKVVRHLVCDNRLCVNVAHLALGTHAENSADMTRKQRQARGERQHLAKLTAEQVLTIRGAWNSGVASQQALADAFGIDQTGVSAIVLRKTWKHI